MTSTGQGSGPMRVQEKRRGWGKATSLLMPESYFIYWLRLRVEMSERGKKRVCLSIEFKCKLLKEVDAKVLTWTRV